MKKAQGILRRKFVREEIIDELAILEARKTNVKSVVLTLQLNNS